MINVIIKEEIEGDYAKFKKVVTFFKLPIYSSTTYTTNIDAIKQFKKIKQTKVKGFKYED